MRKQLAKGDIVRIFSAPFGDAVVTTVHDNGNVDLARPMAWANDISRVPLISFEIISDVPRKLWENYEYLDSRGTR